MTIVNIGDHKKNSETNEPEIIKLSASSVKTYEQCPRKYYYNYIDKQKKKSWPHFDLGNLCHKTLELFHEIYMKEGLKHKTLAKLMGHCFEQARKDFPYMNVEMVQEAKDMLAAYLKKVKTVGMPDVRGVEQSFNVMLRDDVLVRGFLDRVDIMNDGRFHIVDYKTTKNEKYLDPFQLTIYGIWLKEEYPHVEEFKGSYVLLRKDSKPLSYEFNMEDVEKAKKELIAYAEKIGNENAWTPVPSKLCDWCDFKEICPAHDTGW